MTHDEWGMPMNPSRLFPAAPGEAELEFARPYQHAHRPNRSEPPHRPPGKYGWAWNRNGRKVQVWIPDK